MSDPPAHFDPLDVLDDAGKQADDAIPLADTALALAALDHPGLEIAPYREHLDTLCGDLAEVARSVTGTEAACAAMARVFVEVHGYAGDEDSYADMQNADLIRVIDRRKGLPVALGILHLIAGRAAGWQLTGLNFPGHFLVSLVVGREDAIIDPFHGAQIRDPGWMIELLAKVTGEGADRLEAHLRPNSDRDVLLRLQNNIKSRAQQAGDSDRVFQILQRMQRFAPARGHLWREQAVLLARVGQIAGAIAAARTYKRKAIESNEHDDAASLLESLQRALN